MDHIETVGGNKWHSAKGVIYGGKSSRKTWKECSIYFKYCNTIAFVPFSCAHSILCVTHEKLFNTCLYKNPAEVAIKIKMFPFK